MEGGQDTSQMETAVSGDVVLLWAARWLGQSKEMSWASLPCTCSPCGGGCWATGWGCWGGPPAGAIWGTRGHWCSSPGPAPPVLAALEHPPSLVPGPLQPRVRPHPLVMGSELHAPAGPTRGTPTGSMELSLKSTWFAPLGAACPQGLWAKWLDCLSQNSPLQRAGAQVVAWEGLTCWYKGCCPEM